MNKQELLLSLRFVIFCLIISGFAGWVTKSNLTLWYDGLVKPSFAPPDIVFGPVWTILYIMIGFAGGRAWLQRHTQPALWYAYAVQLILNFIWSFIFFGAHSIVGGLIDIILLWLAIAVTVILAFRCDRATAYWLLPYWAWVTFAAALNYQFWVLN